MSILTRKKNSFLFFLNKIEYKKQWLFFGIVAVLLLLAGSHQDVNATATQGYILIDDILTGNFLNFYNDTADTIQADASFSIPAYNIVIYLVFAIFQVPAYIFDKIVGRVGWGYPTLLMGKITSLFFLMGCIFLVYKISRKLGNNPKRSSLVSLTFALFPITLFSGILTGHYDTIETFFILLGVFFWVKGDLTKFSFWIGVGVTFKFFAFIPFIPLLLLREKRILHIIKNIVISLWLIVPSNLLFLGRKSVISDAVNMFNEVMFNRLFETYIPGIDNLPIFPTLFFIICVCAFFLRPATKRINSWGIWLCLVSLGVFSLTVSWHPQWIIMVTPFFMLTSLDGDNTDNWFWNDLAFTAGFLLFTLSHWIGAFESQLFSHGIIARVFLPNELFYGKQYLIVINLLGADSILFKLAFPVFSGALLIRILLKMPLNGKTLEYKMSGNTLRQITPQKQLAYIWGLCGLYLVLHLVPSTILWVFSIF